MKTVSVRIGERQAEKLREVADQMPGSSMNGMVQRAVDLWLEIEGPVYLEALQGIRDRGRKRQAVTRDWAS